MVVIKKLNRFIRFKNISNKYSFYKFFNSRYKLSKFVKIQVLIIIMYCIMNDSFFVYNSQ
jgi:hypothetical protein